MFRLLLNPIKTFLLQRLMHILRLLTGLFMLAIGLWFLLAPITQQFFSKTEELQDAPFLWLIVPLGLLQIAIGMSILRGLHKPSTKE